MTTIAKIRAEIERRRDTAEGKQGEYYLGQAVAFSQVLDLLDTLQEQPASEGLEEEIERVCAEIEEKNPQHRGLKPSGIAKIARHFAEWGATHLKR